ncbi:MAG: alkaline phosphatase D family protein [Myxococcota bacterium]
MANRRVPPPSEIRPSELRRRQLLHGAAVLAGGPAYAACAGDDTSDPVGPPAPEVFLHGVASGDPRADSVIIWSRAEPKGGETEVEVSWTVAADPEFTEVIDEGSVATDGERDFTVKVDVIGLQAGTTYYYRFAALGETSRVGRTKTAPGGSVDRLRFAVCSCASYAHGFYNAYRRIAARADLDLVIHLGDYIYEYGTNEFGDVRPHEPEHEIVTLSDYRRRYGQYRRDPDLQEVHRQHPFAVVWDDHESANDAWREGAENHTEGEEGTWEERTEIARRVYFEWMPIRDVPEQSVERVLRYGDLVDLIMLDTRLCCRDEVVGFDEPGIDDPTRSLLGAEQEQFLFDELSASTATWKLLGQQVMFGQLGTLNPDQWDGYPAARARVFDHLEGEGIDDVVVLTGDIHTSWGLDLARDPLDPATYDPATGDGSLAVEFVAPGISSPGFPPALAGVAEGLQADNPHMKYVDVTLRGYVVLDIDRERVQGAWYHIDTVETRSDVEMLGVVLETARGTNHLVEVAAPADPPASAPPAP